MSTKENPAHAFGIASVPAAAIFAAIYSPLMVHFIRQMYARKMTVFFALFLFCAIRVTAFIMRAALASSDMAGQGESSLARYRGVFDFGFYELLYFAEAVVLMRQDFCDISCCGLASSLIWSRDFHNQVLIVAVVSTVLRFFMETGHRILFSTELFSGYLMLATLIAYQTFVLARFELKGKGYKASTATFGAKYGTHIVISISVLLFIRQVFVVASAMNDPSEKIDEIFWYPFVALPEVLVTLLFTIPDLVPTRAEMKTVKGKAKD